MMIMIIIMVTWKEQWDEENHKSLSGYMEHWPRFTLGIL